MKIKPLIQLRELIAAALKSQTNLSKSFQSFFKEAMELFLTIPNRINFLQMERFGHSSEQRFRMNFRKKCCDWIRFNKSFIAEGNPERRAIAIDPSYISKSGKKTPGLGYFWSGCASSMKWGLELMGFALVDADATSGTHLIAKQTFNKKRRGRVPEYLKHMDNPNSLVGQYLRTINSLKDELISISKCMVADAFFSKESFVTGLNSLGFSLISRFRDDVRLKYLYTGPKTGQRGRPKKFIGDVDLKKLDMSIFETFASGDIAIYSAIVWAVSLKREVKVVIADFNGQTKRLSPEKYSSRPTHRNRPLTYLKFTELDFKSSFCTVTQSNILACAIASQGIAAPWISPLTCRYPQSTLRDSSELNTAPLFRSVMSKCCCTMLQWSNDYFPCLETAQT